MTKLFKISTSFLVALATVFTIALAHTVQAAEVAYPWTNPTYIPNADPQPVTYTAPSTAYFIDLNSIGTVSLRVTGTCTSLAATFQGSNDKGSNYTALNLYPIATGTSTPTAVASISAVGFWKINTTGMNRVRVNVSALTASCTFKLLGTPGGFNGTQF
jgi:hypothetical protein